MLLTILTSEKQLYHGNVLKVTLPGVEGNFQIFPKHASIHSLLQRGDIICTSDKGDVFIIGVAQGVMQAAKDKIKIFITTAQ